MGGAGRSGGGIFRRWRSRRAAGREVELAGGLSDGEMRRLLVDAHRLRDRAARAGVELDGTPGSLAELDRLVPAWRADPAVAARLAQELGGYLGAVVVRNLAWASWQRSDDGRAVVRLGSRGRLDVFGLVRARLADEDPGLAAVYERILAGP